MRLVGKFLKALGIVAGFVATYGFLIAEVLEVDMLGLAWPYWAMIGFTIFWVSMLIVLVQQHLEIRKLRSPEAELERQKKQLEIEELEAKKLSRETDFRK